MPDQKAMGFEDGLRRIDEQIADVRHMVHLWLEERTAIPRVTRPITVREQ